MAGDPYHHGTCLMRHLLLVSVLLLSVRHAQAQMQQQQQGHEGLHQAAGQQPADALVFGEGCSMAAVGRTARFTIQLVDSAGDNITSGGHARSITVLAAPPPLQGGIMDNADGTYSVELIHEWETSDTAGLYTNISVTIGNRHVTGSPFTFHAAHQYAVTARPGSMAYPAHTGSRRFAYVTLIASDDFVDGALVLADSLRRARSLYPVLAMCTARVSERGLSLLRHFGVEIVQVEPVGNPFAAFKERLEEKAWEQVYTKVRAWSLYEFDRVLFMDADQLVLQNIDHLFATPLTNGFAAVPDVAPPIFFNSGLMLLEPSVERHSDMLGKMHSLPSYDDGDQGFLNAYFGQRWDRLGYAYNFMKSKTGNPDAFYWILDNKWSELYVIHMVGVKPWRCSRRRDCGGFPERVLPRVWALWWDAFEDMCESNRDLIDCHDPVGGVSRAAELL